MKKLSMLILSLLFIFSFGGCDMGPLDLSGINWNIEYKYDTLRFQLDSLSVWNTEPAGSSIYTHKFDKSYFNIKISFYGETNLKDPSISGTPEIEYGFYSTGYFMYGDTLTGYAEINNFYTNPQNVYFAADSLYVAVRFSQGEPGKLKYVGLKSLYIEGECIHFDKYNRTASER